MLRRVVVVLGISVCGVLAGFFALSLLMPPVASSRNVAATPPSEAPPSRGASSYVPPPPAAAPVEAPSPSGTPDDLHDPDHWKAGRVAQKHDADVEYDDVSAPSPAKNPAAKPGKKPAAKPAVRSSKPATEQSPRHGSDDGDGPAIDTSRARDLEKWKPEIAAYSKRHYGEATWELKPTCIVLHFTAGTGFPENLASSGSFAGEAPGLASHYVIDGTHVWQLLPPDVRSRGAYGINHRGINIEMVAANASDLARRPKTLQTCVALVRWLMKKYDIPKSRVYSHEAVSHMNPREVPEVLDNVNSKPYGKPDPGEQNLRAIKAQL